MLLSSVKNKNIQFGMCNKAKTEKDILFNSKRNLKEHVLILNHKTHTHTHTKASP